MAQGKQGSEFAVELDLEGPVFRYKADFIDESSDCLRCFSPHAFIVEGVDKMRHLVAVHLRDVGM